MYVCLAGFMKTVPSDSWSPHTLNWPNQSKYRQETQLLPMVLLRWLSSWFLISKRNIQVHQKDTLDLAIHSSCLQALNDGGCLRLNQVLSREFKVKSPLPDFLPPPRPSLARAWGEWFQWASNITRIWHDKLKVDMTRALTLPEQD